MTMATKLNLGCGKQSREGYHNVDLRKLPGVDEAVNLFVFPWPWPDNSFDEVYASHLVEHIPHTVRQKVLKVNNYQFDEQHPRTELEPIWDEDGFFVFFREVHRVLKVGGLCEIVVPFARSTGADQDPTHTRYINEVTFSYLWQEDKDNPNFDYELGYKFEQVNVEYAVNPGWEHADPTILNTAIQQYWNVVPQFKTILRKV